MRETSSETTSAAYMYDEALLGTSGRPLAWRRIASYLTWDRMQLTIVFTLFVILRAMDRVFNKRVADRMADYQLMYVNVFWPAGVQLMTILMVGMYVGYQRWQRGDKRYGLSFFFPGASIATARGPYPQWRLSLFSFWDQLNAVITGLPSPFLDATSQAILSNLVVVWTVLISLGYLGTRYAQEHYIGCILILVAGLVCVIVELQTGNPPLGQYRTPSGSVAIASSSWYVLYVIGTVPAGISNCYKQKCLKSVDLEVMYATLCSGYWQIVWGFLMFPLNWIPLPSPAPRYSPAGTDAYLSDAWTCFLGGRPAGWAPPEPAGPTAQCTLHTNVTMPSADTCDLSYAPLPVPACPCECAARPEKPSRSSARARLCVEMAPRAADRSAGGSAAVWFVVYLLFNVTFNVLLLWLTKRMSATWATIATVLCLDLTSLFSMSSALMGDEATPVTAEQYVGLGIAGIAMWVYSLAPELDANGAPVEGAHAFESRASTMCSFAADRASLLGRASFAGRAPSASHSQLRPAPTPSDETVDGLRA